MEGFRFSCCIAGKVQHEIELPSRKFIHEKLETGQCEEAEFRNLSINLSPYPSNGPPPISSQIFESLGLKCDFLIKKSAFVVIVYYNSEVVSGIDVESSLTFLPYRPKTATYNKRAFKSAKSDKGHKCFIKYEYVDWPGQGSSWNKYWKWTDKVSVSIEFDLKIYPVAGLLELKPLHVEKAIDAEPFFMSADMSDVIVSVGDVNYSAHKFVLAASSAVFKRMLQSGMKEGEENRIQIPDVHPAAVVEMLRFLYMRKCQNGPDLLVDLYKLSHVYEIWGLERLTFKQLLETVSLENAPEMYALGELYGKEAVMTKALDLAAANKERFVKDPETLVNLTNTYPNFMFKFSCL